MEHTQITCDRVDRDDLDTRYLAGTLDEGIAEAFEAHYFECDRCWALVHRGSEIRSVGRAAPLGQAVRRPKVRWRAWAWAPLAAAAVLVLWIGTRPTNNLVVDGDTRFRGSDDSLRVSTASTGGALHAAWSRVPGATIYQVRLFSATGDVLWERRATDTALMVARDSVPGASTGTLFWQVQAFDRAGESLARSTLAGVRADSTIR